MTAKFTQYKRLRTPFLEKIFSTLGVSEEFEYTSGQSFLFHTIF